MTLAACSCCKAAPARQGQRWCRECHRLYMNAYRAKRSAHGICPECGQLRKPKNVARETMAAGGAMTKRKPQKATLAEMQLVVEKVKTDYPSLEWSCDLFDIGREFGVVVRDPESGIARAVRTTDKSAAGAHRAAQILLEWVLSKRGLKDDEPIPEFVWIGPGIQRLDS